jgi:hypothetical protein
MLSDMGRVMVAFPIVRACTDRSFTRWPPDDSGTGMYPATAGLLERLEGSPLVAPAEAVGDFRWRASVLAPGRPAPAASKLWKSSLRGKRIAEN